MKFSAFGRTKIVFWDLLTKTLLVMKLTMFLLLAFCLEVSAKGYSQEKITLNEKNAPLEKVFVEIQKQSGYRIWCEKKLLAQTTNVNIEVINASLEEVLDICFKGQPLTYEIVKKLIVVKKRALPTKVNSPFTQLSEQEVKGVVKTEEGLPLVGATVTLKGLKIFGMTDENGDFVLYHVPNGKYKIVITFIGYEKLEIEIIVSDNNGGINAVLKRALINLDETVVKGYYNTTKRLNTGNVSKVTADEISRQPVSNPLQALEGRMPGVYIQQATGVPGGAIKIQIRGQNSLRIEGNDPLYIVDGVPFPSTTLSSGPGNGIFFGGTSPLNSINPSDIESIEVLKDGDATAIYGTRGANGVVLISTKKGQVSKTKVSINIYTGQGRVTRMMNLLNTPQYLQMRREAFKNDGFDPSPYAQYYPDLFSWDTTRYTNWQKTLIGGTSKTNNAQFSMSGGNANTQFLISGGYYRETTVFPGNFAYQKGSGHVNLNHTSENKKFNTSLSVSYVSDNYHLPKIDITNQALNLVPDAPSLYDSIGKLNWQKDTWANPIATYLLPVYKGTTENMNSNALLSYEVVPALNVKLRMGYNSIKFNEFSNSPTASFYPDYASYFISNSSFGNNSNKTWIIEPQADYSTRIASGRLNFLVGATFQESTNVGQTVTGYGFTSDALLENLSAASSVTINNSNYSKYKYNAFFGRLNYDMQGKYLLNLTARRDGSSRFGPGKQFANFGAIGVAWIFSKEKIFSKTSSLLSFGKLRGSYGLTGSDQIGDYGFLDSYSSTSLPYLGTSGLIPTQLVNPDFAWETNRKFEVALQFGFLHDQILFMASWYSNRSSNQLVGYSLPLITGFSTVQANLPATVQNTGTEFELSTINIKTKHFTWATSVNFTFPRNKLVDYPNLDGSSYANRYVIGKSLYTRKLFHFIGVNELTGIYQFATKGGPTFNPSYPQDLQAVKQIAQNFYGGFQTSINYKGFQLDLLFQFVKQTGANYLSNGFQQPGAAGSNQPTAILNRWGKPGDVTNVQRLGITNDSVNTAYSNFLNSDANISDASFIRFKNLSLSYQLPENLKQKMHLQNCKIYVQGQNLFTITNFLGLDPENQNASALPPLRMLTVGIQLIF